MAASIRSTSPSPVSSSVIEDDFDLDALLDECLENFQTIEESDDKKQELVAASSSHEIRPQEISVSRATASDADRLLDEYLDFPDELAAPTVPYTTFFEGFTNSIIESIICEGIQYMIKDYRADPNGVRDEFTRLFSSSDGLGVLTQKIPLFNLLPREVVFPSIEGSILENIGREEASYVLHVMGFQKEEIDFLIQQKDIWIDILMAEIDALSKQSEVIISYISSSCLKKVPVLALMHSPNTITKASMESYLLSFLDDVPTEIKKQIQNDFHKYIGNRYFSETKQQENF